MSVTDKETIKRWFKRGLKPLETQFHAWMDSYWHKAEKIPMSTVDKLEHILNQKAETADLENTKNSFSLHLQDEIKHKTEGEQAKLDNLASNPNETYATKDELTELIENPEIIIIPVDLRLGYSSIESSIKEFVTPLVEDGTFFSRPVYLKYIYKNDYVTEGAETYSLLVKGEATKGSETPGIHFNSPIQFTDAEYPDEPYAYDIRIIVSQGDVRVRIDDFYREINTVVCTETRVYSNIPEGQVIYLNTSSGIKAALKAKDEGKEYILRYKIGDYLAPGYIDIQKQDRTQSVFTTGYQTVRKDTDGTTIYEEYKVTSKPFTLAPRFNDISAVECTCTYRRVPLSVNNVINIDCSVPFTDKPSAALHEQLKNISFSGNIVLNFFKKTEKVHIQMAQLVAHCRETSSLVEIIAPITNPRLIQLVGFNYVSIYHYPADNESYLMAENRTEEKERHVFFLWEDGDNIISLGDNAGCQWGTWDDFAEVLRKGERPALYLRTSLSPGYVPANYFLNPTGSTPERFSGFIEIQHLTTDKSGNRVLTSERREFLGEGNPFGGMSSAYESNLDGVLVDGPLIERVNLDDVIRPSRIQVVAEYPADLSGLKEGDILILNPVTV